MKLGKYRQTKMLREVLGNSITCVNQRVVGDHVFLHQCKSTELVLTESGPG